MKYYIFRKPYYNPEMTYSTPRAQENYCLAFSNSQPKFDGETEKAICLEWAEKEWGRIKYNRSWSHPFNDLWIAKSQVEIDYKEHDGSPWIYLKIPAWIFASKRVFPNQLVNFEFFEEENNNE